MVNKFFIIIAFLVLQNNIVLLSMAQDASAQSASSINDFKCENDAPSFQKLSPSVEAFINEYRYVKLRKFDQFDDFNDFQGQCSHLIIGLNKEAFYRKKVAALLEREPRFWEGIKYPSLRPDIALNFLPIALVSQKANEHEFGVWGQLQNCSKVEEEALCYDDAIADAFGQLKILKAEDPDNYALRTAWIDKLLTKYRSVLGAGDHAQALIEKAELNLEMGETKQALRYFQAALSVNPMRAAPSLRPVYKNMGVKGIGNQLQLRTGYNPDRDAQPLVRIPPPYPSHCKASPTYTDYVNLVFDVTPDGIAQNIQVVDASNYCFMLAAIRSVARWKYPPKIVDGKRLWRRGVRTRITFNAAPG